MISLASLNLVIIFSIDHLDAVEHSYFIGICPMIVKCDGSVNRIDVYVYIAFV